MSYSIEQGPTTFWLNAERNFRGLVQRDGLHMVLLSMDAPMRVLLRNTERLFTDAAPRLAGSPTVIINGNFYDVTRLGLLDAFSGGDPVDPDATTPLGRLVNQGTVIGGSTQTQMFYLAQVTTPLIGPPAPGQVCYCAYSYETGFGAAPVRSGVQAAIGGLGPMIIGGLKYGDGNLYRVGAPSPAPESGKPPEAARPFLIQRNNKTYTSAAAHPPGTGKTIVAVCSYRARLLIVVQADGSSGQRLDHVRDRLFDLGFDHAVFFDGSDSSCLWHGGSWRIMPGSDKNETNTVGLAFG